MRKVLIVDDEEEAVEVLSECLSDIGYITQTALNGEEALALLKDESYDLMILDLRMPQVDGEGVLRVLDEYCPGIAVIVATGYSDGGVTRAKIEKYNVDGYIEKPIDLNELECCIRLIEKKKSKKTEE